MCDIDVAYIFYPFRIPKTCVARHIGDAKNGIGTAACPAYSIRKTNITFRYFFFFFLRFYRLECLQCSRCSCGDRFIIDEATGGAYLLLYTVA